MNEKLPKPMLEALAREAKPQEHPSADALAAFAEQALTEREYGSVAEHLAQCAECREVVFLASGAVEEVTEPAGELSATTFRREHLRAVAASAVGEMPRTAMVSKPRRSWIARGLWATSAAAVLVMVGGLFLWQHPSLAPPAREMASNSAPTTPQTAADRGETEEAKAPARVLAPVPKTHTRAAPTQANVPRAETVTPSAPPEIALSTQPTAPQSSNEQRAGTSAPKPPAGSAQITIDGTLPRPVPSSPKAYGFVPNAGQGQEQVDSVNIAVSRAVATGARTGSGWRISPQGHLEHLGSTGWTRELTNEPNIFRAVAVVGSDVWAGGDKGTFFHSADSGQHWNKVALAGESGGENGSIVSIRFNDAQNGEVSTDRGANYVTSDGGTTWTKR